MKEQEQKNIALLWLAIIAWSLAFAAGRAAARRTWRDMKQETFHNHKPRPSRYRDR